MNLATELVVSEQVNELSRSELEEGGTTFTSSTELPMHTLFQQSAAASASASDLNSNGFFFKAKYTRSTTVFVSTEPLSMYVRNGHITNTISN